jgi:hypothetical protein
VNSDRKVALLWHGDRDTRRTATLEENRLRGVAEALRQVGIAAQPAVYADDFVDEVRDQLLKVDAVLVWVNPVEQGRDRSVLDAMLAQVADQGVLVSAHPEVIRKMGTKEVLFRTRDMNWGCDTHLYSTVQELRRQLPLRLMAGKPRILKQNRGNGGDGVWKVELVTSRPGESPQPGTPVRVRHALRGSVEEAVTFGEFLARCEPYFSGSGRIIDQAYQERLAEGMVRCYLVRNEVVGFGHQLVNALFPASLGMSPDEAPQPGPRLYYPATRSDFQALKTKVETEWVPAMGKLLDIEVESLPVVWDADFLYGPKDATNHDTYVLCEINVSSVYPFPDEALAPLARETCKRLQAVGGKRRRT